MRSPGRVAARPGLGATNGASVGTYEAVSIPPLRSSCPFHSLGGMFGQGAAGGSRPVPADVRPVLGAFCDLRVVLPRAPILRGGVSSWGADREPPCIEPAAPAE